MTSPKRKQIYPCKPDIFEQTYGAVSVSTPPPSPQPDVDELRKLAEKATDQIWYRDGSMYGTLCIKDGGPLFWADCGRSLCDDNDANFIAAANPGAIIALLDRLKAAEAHSEKCALEFGRLIKERDLAIAHDRQPYPTADAYEKICAALAASEKRAGEYRKALDIAKEFIEKKEKQARPMSQDALDARMVKISIDIALAAQARAQDGGA